MNKKGLLWTIIIVIIIILVVVFAVKDTTEVLDETNSDLIDVLEENIDEGQVVVDEVTLTEPGYVIVRKDNNGQPGNVIGISALLPAGTYTNLAIEVSDTSDTTTVGDTQTSRRGRVYNGGAWIAVHSDNGDETFTSPEEDPIALDEEGEEVLVEVELPEDSTETGVDEMTDEETVEEETTETNDESDETALEPATTIMLTETGFDPEMVTVSVGDTVRFVNESGRDMWVASAIHPTHEAYSGTSLSEHCTDTDNGAFDQCEAGNTFEFTFDTAGEWGYHNHLNASQTGTIVVE